MILLYGNQKDILQIRSKKYVGLCERQELPLWAESKGFDRAGTAHGLAQRLSDLRVESGLRALGGKGEGRIIVFHADAEDFLGSAAGREPREQQREEEPSQKNGPE